MKRLALVGIIILMVVGCATAPITPDQKAQYVAQARTTLNAANLGISAASIVFLALCQTGDIPLAVCNTGTISLKLWDGLYASTNKTINDYESGVITDQQIVVKVLADVMAIFITIRHDLEGNSAAVSLKMNKDLKAMKLKGVQPCPPCPPAKK